MILCIKLSLMKKKKIEFVSLMKRVIFIIYSSSYFYPLNFFINKPQNIYLTLPLVFLRNAYFRMLEGSWEILNFEKYEGGADLSCDPAVSCRPWRSQVSTDQRTLAQSFFRQLRWPLTKSYPFFLLFADRGGFQWATLRTYHLFFQLPLDQLLAHTKFSKYAICQKKVRL